MRRRKLFDKQPRTAPSSSTWLLLAPSLLLALPVHAAGQTADSATNSTANSAYVQRVLSIQHQIETHDLAGARASIVSTLQKYPADGGLENLLGIVDIEDGDTKAARQDFSAAIRHDPRLAGAMLNLARIDMQTASSDAAARSEALGLDEKALQLEPHNDEANYQIATLLAWQKSYSRSIEHLQRLSPQARTEVGAEALLCTDAASLGDRSSTDSAAAALAANPALTEQDVTSCLPALRTAHRADLIDNLLTTVSQRQPLSAAGERILGLAQEAEGKLPLARATLEKAFTADDQSVPILVDLTRVAKTAGDNQGALGYLAHARQLDPQDASLPYEFGAICLRMGLYGEARKALEEAVRLDPQNPTYNFGLGTVISYSEDPSQAIPYLQKYHSLRPQDPDGLLALGETSFRAKDYESAIPWLKQAAARPRTAAEAHFYLGRIAREEGHLDEATAELNLSLSLHPDQPNVLAEIGQICVGNQNYPQATTYLQRALHLDPDNYGANFGLLQLYARTGDPRRDAQSKRFDQIRQKQEDQQRQMMRVIEIRPGG
ncbi:MAG: tetratricopeptide repeat protein [Acidobacteriaceae bacterium]